MTETQIQLWTDETNMEFAIFVENSHYVVRTNQQGNYTRMVDESPYVDQYSYDWKCTLSQWISYHFGNQLQVLPYNLDKSVIHLFEVSDTEEEEEEKNGLRIKTASLRDTFSKSRPEPKLNPKLLKCHFCNLKYYMDEELREHVKFWHTVISDQVNCTLP